LWGIEPSWDKLPEPSEPVEVNSGKKWAFYSLLF
jgi:hypothetical protein